MTDDLREAVARVIDPKAFELAPTDVGYWRALTDRNAALGKADAAIALIRPAVLEEAVGAVEKYPGTPAKWSWLIQSEIAAAIRAMKGEGR